MKNRDKEKEAIVVCVSIMGLHNRLRYPILFLFLHNNILLPSVFARRMFYCTSLMGIHLANCLNAVREKASAKKSFCLRAGIVSRGRC